MQSFQKEKSEEYKIKDEEIKLTDKLINLFTHNHRGHLKALVRAEDEKYTLHAQLFKEHLVNEKLDVY